MSLSCRGNVRYSQEAIECADGKLVCRLIQTPPDPSSMVQGHVVSPRGWSVETGGWGIPGGLDHHNDFVVCLSVRISNNNGWLWRTVIVVCSIISF